jgi:hypothetical protein
MKPEEVISPVRNWKGIAILVNAGDYSFAVGFWDGRPVLSCRWNGDGDDIGNPQSRGKGTWFVLPSAIYDAVIDSLAAKKLISAEKKTRAKMFLDQTQGWPKD